MADIIRLKRGLSSSWTELNPILAGGEPGYETDTHRHKLGDGTTAWNDLDYAVGGGAGDDGAAMAALIAHIAAAEPHSIYDDGPSLVLLYENVKAG